MKTGKNVRTSFIDDPLINTRKQILVIKILDRRQLNWIEGGIDLETVMLSKGRSHVEYFNMHPQQTHSHPYPQLPTGRDKLTYKYYNPWNTIARYLTHHTLCIGHYIYCRTTNSDSVRRRKRYAMGHGTTTTTLHRRKLMCFTG